MAHALANVLQKLFRKNNYRKIKKRRFRTVAFLCPDGQVKFAMLVKFAMQVKFAEQVKLPTAVKFCLTAKDGIIQ